MKRLKDIFAGIPLQNTMTRPDMRVSGIAFDSRQVSSGHVFVAIKGTLTDGHQFIEAAVSNGAVAVVGQQRPDFLPQGVEWIQVKDSYRALAQMAANFYDHPSGKLKLVGVTGTNGKTTTVTVLYQAFMRLGKKAGLLSTIENKIGATTIPATHTTPDPVTINRLLSEMVAEGCEAAFMEVSSHAIDQGRIHGLHFEGAVFTNLTREHLDYHGTMLDYLNVKKSFFDDLPSTAFALANIDDKNGPVMLQNTAARQYTMALKRMADFNANVISNSLDGLHLSVNGHDVFTRLIGRFNAYNLLSAFSVAALLGVDETEALRVLSVVEGAPGRFEKVQDPYSRRLGIVDYAHTPDALEKVLDTIIELKPRSTPLMTVVGCGGDRDKTKRPVMGAMAAEKSTQAIFTEDNPRSEDPQQIINEMLEGVSTEHRQKVLTIPDRRSAIRTACRLAKDNGIILVAGKGHEKYQIVKGQKLPFDDKAELIDEFSKSKPTEIKN